MSAVKPRAALRSALGCFVCGLSGLQIRRRETAMPDHTWVNENLDTYLAGDLTTAERESVEQHVAACEECKQALVETRRLERLLNGLFTETRPALNLDERIVQAVKQEPMRTARRRPQAWR